MEWINQTQLSNSSSADKISSLLFGICGFIMFPVILVILFLMLFVYKTYKTNFQRLIIYYILLSLWLDISGAVLIVGAFTVIDGRWVCNILRYLIISSEFAWYVHITAIANFSLFLTVYLIRVRGRPLSKRSSKYMECICIISAVVIGLTVASIIEMYNDLYALDVECAILGLSTFGTKLWGISYTIFFVMDLEVILVSISLCVVFCFICRRIHNRQTAVLLRNSVLHVTVNACIIGMDSFRMGYNIYLWSEIDRDSLGVNIPHIMYVVFYIWDIVFVVAVGVSIITQAVLCIQASTGRNACCKSHCCILNVDQYRVIRGSDGGKDASATNPASSHVSQPSYTDFAIPYTGEFTQVTASVNSDGENELKQLIE